MINATSGFPGTSATSASAPSASFASDALPLSGKNTDNTSFTPSSNSPAPKKKAKLSLKMIVGLLVVGLTLVGGAVGFYLSGQSQDVRQQAAGDPFTDAKDCSFHGSVCKCTFCVAGQPFNCQWDESGAKSGGRCGGGGGGGGTPTNPPAPVMCDNDTLTATVCRNQAVGSTFNVSSTITCTCQRTTGTLCGCMPSSPLPAGSSCTANSNCQSGVCANNVCQASNLPIGTSCSTNANCQSGLCLNNVCQSAGSGCTPGSCVNGRRCDLDPTTGGGFVGNTSCSVCTTNSQCPSSQFCQSGNCANKRTNGTACEGAFQCQSGICSETGRCVAIPDVGGFSCEGQNTGTACSTATLGSAGYCSGATCVAKLENGRSCQQDYQCTSSICNAGTCSVSRTPTCTTNNAECTTPTGANGYCEVSGTKTVCNPKSGLNGPCDASSQCDTSQKLTCNFATEKCVLIDGGTGNTSCLHTPSNTTANVGSKVCLRKLDPNGINTTILTCTSGPYGLFFDSDQCGTGQVCADGQCISQSGTVNCCLNGQNFKVNNVGQCSQIGGNVGACSTTDTCTGSGTGFSCKTSCGTSEVAASGKSCGVGGGQCCVTQVDNTGPCTASLVGVTRCQTETSTLPRVYTCKATNGSYAWILNPGPNNYCGGTGIADCGANSDYYCSNGKEAGDSCGPTVGYGICNFANADTLGVNKSCICAPRQSVASPTAIASPTTPPTNPPTNPPANNEPTPTPTTPPTNPPGPMCIAITMSNVTLASRSVPILGDAVRFTCATVEGATKYIFRVLEPDGQTQSLQATGTVSETYTISKSGKHFAQCQICTGTNGESCHTFETVNTN